MNKGNKRVANKPLTGKVVRVNSGNCFMLKVGKRYETLCLSNILTPMFNKKENKEEKYTFEAMNYLRELLIGKQVQCTVNHITQKGMKMVTCECEGKNIIAEMIAAGYAVYSGKGAMPKEIQEASTKAQTEKHGIYNPEAQSLQKPEKLFYDKEELIAYTAKLNETNGQAEGYISSIISPDEYILTTPNRREINIKLYGTYQALVYDKIKKTYLFDEDGTECMDYLNDVYLQRNVKVTFINESDRIFATVYCNGTDIGEDLIKNGYVLVIKNLDLLTEEIKQKYVAAETIAKKKTLHRWSEYDEEEEKRLLQEQEERQKKLEDRKNNVVVFKGHLHSLGFGIMTVQTEKNELVDVKFASIKLWYDKSAIHQNENVVFRFKELTRKLVAGKEITIKKAYDVQYVKDGKAVEESFYDVYVEGRNIAVDLLKSGYCIINIDKDELKQSFDIEELKKIRVKKADIVPIREIDDMSKAKELQKELIGKQFTGSILSVISPNKYRVFLEENNTVLNVFLYGCKLPTNSSNKDLKAFIKEARDKVSDYIDFADIKITFKEYATNYLTEIEIAKGSVNKFVLTNAYAFDAEKYELKEVKKLKQQKQGVYQYDVNLEEIEEPKQEIVQNINFQKEQKIYISGFDGVQFYYYDNGNDYDYVKQISKLIEAEQKVSIKTLKEGSNVAVNWKNVLYRGEIVSVQEGGNLVRLIDTGNIICVGKNKIKVLPKAIDKKPVNVKTIGLVAIHMTQPGDIVFDTFLQTMTEKFTNQFAVMEIAKHNENLAKIKVNDEDISTFILSNGYAYLADYFKDGSNWGYRMKEAQAKAQKERLNLWQFGGKILDNYQIDN